MNNSYRKKYAGVRTVVFGSTGFIGRWVARELCDAGAKVVLPVRRSGAVADVFDKYDIEGDICELDLLDAQSVRSLYREVCPTVTFNLAGYGVDREEQNEELAYQTNADLIRTVCSAISEVRDHGWTGLDIVNVGTAMEYGLAQGDLAEDSLPDPTTLYGKSKLAGTRALTDCCRRFGLKGVTARLFSVYGPGESPQRLLPTLIHAARTEIQIPLTAGMHTRDFVYVEDAAESLMRLALLSSLSGDVVNVATGVLSSIKTFAETAAETLGISHDRLRFGSLQTRSEEMNHEPVNVERLRSLIGWVPNTMTEAGIQKTFQFRRSSPRDLVRSQMGAGNANP
ncbi:MAG: NAD(P)-dependent oxidoreductase [Acidobacteria bacterium]|nr:NAD(P)-dependent oxidoreductase [Acidobacteriota bacterium]